MPKELRSRWSSNRAFILAATGAAVGLGNIWKFPYMAGDNGGSAFVIVYLICVIFVGLPVMMGEITLGRCGRQNPVNTMKNLAIEAKTSPAWQFVGWWGCIALVLILSFYSVISGWSIAYLVKIITTGFTNLNEAQIHSQWQNFLQHPWQLLLWHSIFMFMTMYVVEHGVRHGLERASNILMPGLLIILLVLAVYSCEAGNAKQAFHFLFSFKFEKITSQVIIDALGHAFFTLALGAGCMLMYGAYVPGKISIAKSVVIIALLDIMVAFFSGMAIFPLVFKYNLAPEGGPGLMFEVLPIAFAKMQLGNIIGFLFFILLLFAAWTSSISLAEPLVTLLHEKTKLSRKTSSIIIGMLAWLLGILSILSFNIYSNVKLFNRFDIFTFITDLTTNIFLPIGGLLFSIFAGWKLSRHKSKQVLGLNTLQFKTWLFLVRYIAPIAIIIILLGSLV